MYKVCENGSFIWKNPGPFFKFDFVRFEKKRVLIFAASADKELSAMLSASKTYFTDIVLTRYATNPRAATITRLRKAAGEGGWQDPHVAASPTEAVAVGKRLAGRSGLLCIAGSFFLASEVRPALGAIIDS